MNALAISVNLSNLSLTEPGSVANLFSCALTSSVTTKLVTESATSSASIIIIISCCPLYGCGTNLYVTKYFLPLSNLFFKTYAFNSIVATSFVVISKRSVTLHWYTVSFVGLSILTSRSYLLMCNSSLMFNLICSSLKLLSINFKISWQFFSFSSQLLSSPTNI